MTPPSEERLLVLSLISAAVGLLAFFAFEPTEGGPVLLLAIVVLAILVLVDGYRNAA